MNPRLEKLTAALEFDSQTIEKLRSMSDHRTGIGVIGQLDRDWLKTILDDHQALSPIHSALKAVVEALEGVVRDGQYAEHATEQYLAADRPKQNVIKTGTPMRSAKARAETALAALDTELAKLEGRG